MAFKRKALAVDGDGGVAEREDGACEGLEGAVVVDDGAGGGGSTKGVGEGFEGVEHQHVGAASGADEGETAGRVMGVVGDSGGGAGDEQAEGHVQGDLTDAQKIDGALELGRVCAVQMWAVLAMRAVLGVTGDVRGAERCR